MKIIKIGRLHENDCVIDNPNVSRIHAELHVDADGQHAMLFDLGSTYGTYINGSQNRITTSVRVSRTDTIRFGSEVMTMAEVLERARRKKAASVPQDIQVTNRIIIGKVPKCQIVLPYDNVSRKHAAIYKDTAGNVYIEDLNSTNGTYVNGERVAKKMLRPSDVVMIAEQHRLDWEKHFPVESATPKPKPILTAVLTFVLCLLLAGGGYAGYRYFGKWDKEKVYNEYSSAVCWVCIEYGYQIMVDNEDFTPVLCQLCQIPSDNLVYLEDNELHSGPKMAQGTAFFISNDGKLATNLHITRPWLVSEEQNELEVGVNKLLTILSQQNPRFLRSKVEIKHVMKGIHIIPNGLPINEANAIDCVEISNNDDISKDVAVIQTQTRKLPTEVKKVIDITKADASDEAVGVGKTVFTIGYPYGATIALDSHQTLKNQIHDGSVTQNRGEYEYGHDAETAGGASGSPIINEKGRLVGVHHAGMTGITGAQGFNSAIKVKYLLELVK